MFSGLLSKLGSTDYTQSHGGRRVHLCRLRDPEIRSRISRDTFSQCRRSDLPVEMRTRPRREGRCCGANHLLALADLNWRNLAGQMLVLRYGEVNLWRKLTIRRCSVPSHGFTKTLQKFRHTARSITCFRSSSKNPCDWK